MDINKYRKILAVIALCGMLNGCATFDNLLKPRVSNLVSAPDFVPEVYYQEKFLIAPAFSSYEDIEFTPSQLRVMSNGMQGYFVKKRPGIEVIGHEICAKSLGLDQSQKLSKEFKSTGTLSDRTLEQVISKTGARYVVFSDLMDEKVDSNWNESKEGNHYNVYVSADRELTAMYTVIDTKTGQSSWSGMMKETAYASKSYTHNGASRRSYGEATGALAVIDVLLGEDPRDRYKVKEDERPYEERFPAPNPDSPAIIMAKLHQGFVLNLAKLKEEK